MISPLKFFLKTWLALLVEFTLGHLAVIVTQHCGIQKQATFLVHSPTKTWGPVAIGLPYDG